MQNFELESQENSPLVNKTQNNIPSEIINYSNDYKIIYKFFWLTALIFSILFFIFLFSIKIVSYDEYAIEKTFSGVVRNNVYQKGTYLILSISSLIKFPSTLVEYDFHSIVFTKDGPPITIKIKNYFKIDPKELYYIFDKFSFGFIDIIKKNSEMIIKDSSYSIDDYLLNTKNIEKKLATSVCTELKNSMKILCDINNFKIVNIIFSDSLISNSLMSVLATENNQLEFEKQNIKNIEYETSYQVSSIRSSADLLLSRYSSDANKIKKNADLYSQKIIQDSENDGLNYFLTQLNIDEKDKKNIIKYLFLINNNNKTIFDLQSTNLIIQT